jgi:hypothetical protein
MRSSLLSDYHENHLIWVGLSLVVILELSLVSSIFGLQSPCSASLPGHHENHLIWVDSNLMALLELPLATAHAVQQPNLDIWEPSDLSGLNAVSLPLGFMQFVPLSSPWRSLIIVYCAFFVYSFILQWLFIHSVLQFDSTLFDSFVKLFLCLTIVWLFHSLFIVLIMKMYSR